MNYELAKQLKNLGFPQHKSKIMTFPKLENPLGYYIGEESSSEKVYVPTLSELIEVCGDKFGDLQHIVGKRLDYPVWSNIIECRKNKLFWIALPLEATDCFGQYGETPEEAVARLWLELNRKKI